MTFNDNVRARVKITLNEALFFVYFRMIMIKYLWKVVIAANRTWISFDNQSVLLVMD